MSTSATLLQFAAESVLCLVAVAGLALAARADLLGLDRAGRALLGSGFVVLAVAAFLQGSLLVERADGDRDLLVLRIAGAALVALGSVRWSTNRLGRVLLLVGLAGVVAAAVIDTRSSGRAANIVLMAGAATVGASLLAAGGRSIPVRIGVSAAVLTLAVVLGVSLALSVVLTRNVEREAARRYGSRTSDEAAAAVASARGSLTAARLVGGSLAGSARGGDLLVFARTATTAQQARARRNVDGALAELTSDRALAIDDPVLFVSRSGVPESVAPADLDNATRLGLAGNEVVAEALASRGSRQATTVVGRGVYGVATVPVFVRPPGRPATFVGAVVVAARLDDTYLRVRATGGEPLSFSFVTPTGVLARSGSQPPDPVLLRYARRVVSGGERPSGTEGDRFLAARPVASNGLAPELALVASAPTASVVDTRDALFRTLFIVALGSALVAVLGAALLGERIGGGLRRLTATADRIRGGDLAATADLRRADELGVLSSAFDAMTGSLRAMTDDLREAADDELRLRARLQAVVEGMGEALVAVDAHGIVTACNPAADDLLGVDAGTSAGRPLGEVVAFTPTDGDGPVALEAPDDGVAVVAGSVRTAFGEAVPVVVTAGAVRAPDGARSGSVLVLRDVRREEQVERMKTEFLANISHELRTPLTPIKGYAGVLERRPVDHERAARYAREISAGVRQLERVIGQLLNFASVAAGRLELARESVTAGELVASAVDRWREQVEGAPEIAARVASPDAAVAVDRTFLDQAVDELVGNALKYSPAGGRVRIAAEVSNGDSDGEWLRLSVADDGEGIDGAELADLVADFTQGDASATRAHGGLGLGLAFTDRVVRAHGGSLQYDGGSGSGATFTIVLPVEPSSAGGAGG